MSLYEAFPLAVITDSGTLEKILINEVLPFCDRCGKPPIGCEVKSLHEIVNHLYNMETMCLLTACLAVSIQDTGGGGGGGGVFSSPRWPPVTPLCSSSSIFFCNMSTRDN